MLDLMALAYSNNGFETYFAGRGGDQKVPERLLHRVHVECPVPGEQVDGPGRCAEAVQLEQDVVPIALGQANAARAVAADGGAAANAGVVVGVVAAVVWGGKNKSKRYSKTSFVSRKLKKLTPFHGPKDSNRIKNSPTSSHSISNPSS